MSSRKKCFDILSKEQWTILTKHLSLEFTPRNAICDLSGLLPSNIYTYNNLLYYNQVCTKEKKNVQPFNIFRLFGSERANYEYIVGPFRAEKRANRPWYDTGR